MNGQAVVGRLVASSNAYVMGNLAEHQAVQAVTPERLVAAVVELREQLQSDDIPTARRALRSVVEAVIWHPDRDLEIIPRPLEP